MVSRVRYLTHPQVEIDPAIPVTEWPLGAVGRDRVTALAAAGWLSGTSQIIASAERKAIETAEIPRRSPGLSIEVREAMHENDGSATGVLPAAEFDVVVNASAGLATHRETTTPIGPDAPSRLRTGADLVKPSLPNILWRRSDAAAALIVDIHEVRRTWRTLPALMRRYNPRGRLRRWRRRCAHPGHRHHHRPAF